MSEITYDLGTLSKYTLYWSVRAWHTIHGEYEGVRLTVQKHEGKAVARKEFTAPFLEEAIKEAIIWFLGEAHFTPHKKLPPKKKLPKAKAS